MYAVPILRNLANYFVFVMLCVCSMCVRIHFYFIRYMYLTKSIKWWIVQVCTKNSHLMSECCFFALRFLAIVFVDSIRIQWLHAYTFFSSQSRNTHSKYVIISISMDMGPRQMKISFDQWTRMNISTSSSNYGHGMGTTNEWCPKAIHFHFRHCFVPFSRHRL